MNKGREKTGVVTLVDWHILYEKKRYENVGIESLHNPQESRRLIFSCEQGGNTVRIDFIVRFNKSGLYPNQIRLGLGQNFIFIFDYFN